MLLLCPPSDPYNNEFNISHYYLGAFLKSKSISDFNCLEISYDDTISDTVSRINKTKEKIIGFTCYDSNYLKIKILAKEIKKHIKNSIIILGGPTAIAIGDLILKDCPYIDLAIRSECESILPILFHKILLSKAKKITYDKVPGISYRKNNEVLSTKKGALIKNLDSLPSPYLLKLVPVKELIHNNMIFGISLSRGCVYKCDFCNYSTIYNHTVRFYSIDRIIKELKYVQRICKKENRAALVFFIEDNFCLNLNRAKEILKTIIKKNLNQYLYYYAHTRPENLSYEILDLFKKANFKSVNIGLESASIKVLKQINKTLSKNNKYDFSKEKEYVLTTQKALLYSKKIGLKLIVSLIFGLEADSIAGGKQTLAFIKKQDHMEIYGHNIYSILSGANNLKKEEFEHKFFYDRIFNPKVLPLIPSYKIHPSFFPRLPNTDIFRSLERRFFKYNIAMEQYSVNIIFQKNFDQILGWLFTWFKVGTNYWFDVSNNKESLELGKELNEFPIFLNEYFVSKKFFQASMETSEKVCHKATPFSSISNLKFTNYNKQIQIIKHKGFKRTADNTSFIFSISNEVDNRALSEIMQRLLIDGKFIFETSITSNYWSFLLNACMFYADVCPSMKLNNLLIDKNAKIRTCNGGKHLASIPIDIDELKQTVQKETKKLHARRDCKLCRIFPICPKCLSTHFMSEAKYCKFMKSTPYLKLFFQTWYFVSENIHIDNYCNKKKKIKLHLFLSYSHAKLFDNLKFRIKEFKHIKKSFSIIVVKDKTYMFIPGQEQKYYEIDKSVYKDIVLKNFNKKDLLGLDLFYQ
ncbi:MAG: radical SAM protein [Pseudomonadota bacterium]